MAVAVATVDGVSLGADVPAFGWANYALCWGAIYQFGVAWQSGDLRGRRPMLIASGATLVLAAMIGLRLYPVSMIGVPGQPVQNTSPPTLALLALACVQAGLLVALAPGVTTRLRTARHRGLLEVANRNSFGLYLWHMFPVVLVALAVYPSAMFPQPELGSASWWLWRCAWVAVLSVVTVVELTLLRWTRAVFARPVPTVRTGMRDGLSGPALAAGTIAVAATLSRIAADGFVPAGHPSVAWVAAYVAGVAMVALRPAGVATRHRRARSATSPSEGRAVGRNRTRRAPNREGKQRIS
jgi:hypothetical protein